MKSIGDHVKVTQRFLPVYSKS